MERIELLKITVDPENILKGGAVHLEMSDTPLTDPEKEVFEKTSYQLQTFLESFD